MRKSEKWYIDRYVRAVSAYLPCSRKVKRPLLADLRQRTEEYINDGGNAAALESHFGTPQQVAAAYVDEMPTAELLAELHIRRRIIRIIAIAVITALAIYGAALLWQLYDIHQSLNGWSETYVITERHWTEYD